MSGQFAYAQEQVEKIEVTGTRIPPKNLESISPVTIITAEDIKLEGVRTMENLLNNMPQVFADQGSNISINGTLTATVNLRNLGTSRTLVLVNGRRLPPGDPTATAGYPANINFIPPQLVSRVDVLTGGAAGAVYGSDAVAGVVNFIMNDKFQGVQLDYNNSFYSHHQHGGAQEGDLATRAITNPAQFAVPGDISAGGKTNATSMLIGSNFADGRGNATLFFGYNHTDPLVQAQYDFSACTFGPSGNTILNCGGSSTSYPGRFVNTVTGAGFTVANAAGGTRPFSSATDQYNFGALSYFQRPDERYNFAAFTHYDVTPAIRAYGEFMFMDDNTYSQFGPSGVFFGANQFVFFGDNPLLSQADRNVMGIACATAACASNPILIGRRNVEGGGRQEHARHTDFRNVVGVKGDINKTWSYDISTQWGQDAYQRSSVNYTSNQRTQNGIDVVVGPNGQPACRSFVNGTDPACVPYNIFALGGPSAAALQYIAVPGLQTGGTKQSVSLATINGDLGDYGVRSPYAKEGVQVSAGYEYRKESLFFLPDFEESNPGTSGAGDLGGFGLASATSGAVTYKEVFGEFRAPLVQGREFVKQLGLEGTYRYSQYSNGQSSDSYSIGLDWAPIDQIKFRGSYARAVRAANIDELFSPQGPSLFGMSSDPCAGAAPTATLAQCANTGVTAAQYGKILDNPAGQYNAIVGGNPALRPEKGDTYTIGAVMSPMKNLHVTVDYFNIRISQEVGSLPAAATVSNCLATGNPLFCGLITRDALGTLWLNSGTSHVISTNINLGGATARGIDIGGDYLYRLSAFGSLKFSLIGTIMMNQTNTPVPGQGTFDCVGLYGSNCGVPTPRWRHKAYVNWNTPWNVNLRAQWRHINAVSNEGTSSSPLLNGTLAPENQHFSQRDYLDLAGTWQITKMFSVNGGLNNVFDKDPPVADQSPLGSSGLANGNTYPNFYDTLGRYWFVNLSAKF